MGNFRKLIREVAKVVKEVKPKPIVKVAILDNGASLDSLKSGYPIYPQTFRADNVEHWVGSCPHGSDMVKCVLDVCPFAELYIARLDDSGLAEKQKFTTMSCYKVISQNISHFFRTNWNPCFGVC